MNLWILTEERPKKEVIETICNKYLTDRNIAGFINSIRIIPILENNKFTFSYKVIGINTPKIDNIYIKIISGKNNKFIQIANKLNIKLQDLKIPRVEQHITYWDYDTTGEKIGTIFLDIVVDEFSNGFTIYHNHAECERGYFLTSSGEKLAVKKYTDRAKYKSGDKSEIFALPDLVLKDEEEKEIINIEGEMYRNAQNGIEQLKGFDAFEKSYIGEYYPSYTITRTVVLYGGEDTQKPIGKISFVLTTDGKILISLKAPKLFQKSFENIFDYWRA